MAAANNNSEKENTNLWTTLHQQGVILQSLDLILRV